MKVYPLFFVALVLAACVPAEEAPRDLLPERLPPDPCDDPDRVSQDQCPHVDAAWEARMTQDQVFFASIDTGDVADECNEFYCREYRFESIVLALNPDAVPATVEEAATVLDTMDPTSWTDVNDGGDALPLPSVPVLACVRPVGDVFQGLRTLPICTTCAIITEAPRSVGLVQGRFLELFFDLIPQSAGDAATFNVSM